MNRDLGPHAAIAVRTPRERFLVQLFDRLWQKYRQRVVYVQRYEEVIRAAQATLVNDHIAFRTLAVQRPQLGIASLARLFDALGYRAAGCYSFEDKHLSAIHMQHELGELPKLFISELKTWELPASARSLVLASAEQHRPPLELSLLASLAELDRAGGDFAPLLAAAVDWIETLPWQPPEREALLAVNQASQYAAWVLVHGYNVNHFTSLINAHGVPTLDDIEKTSAALTAAGVPMKKEIEGERGSKLRQTATEAVTIPVAVRDHGQPARQDWTYAYFELAQRDWLPDPTSGKPVRFEGFLGGQATHLFEMTRTGKS